MRVFGQSTAKWTAAPCCERTHTAREAIMKLTKDRFRLRLHPKPELVRLDTSLRYTDILFGFVIREIFLRLQYWHNLDLDAWLYLSVCLALVLGSWIGYRRSLNRMPFVVGGKVCLLRFQIIETQETSQIKDEIRRDQRDNN